VDYSILCLLGFTLWSSLATTWHTWHTASMDSLWNAMNLLVSSCLLWISWMDHTPSSLGFDSQNFTQLPLQPSCIDLWLKVHVKGNIPLLLKVLYVLQAYAEPCTVWLSHVAQCSVIPGFVAWCMGEWKVLPVPLITLLWCITRLEYAMGKMSLGCISLILGNYISQKKFYRHSCSCKISPN